MSMHKLKLSVLTVVFFALGVTTAEAAPTISLESSPADLSSVGVGDALTVDVVLSGLLAGDEIDFLAATIDFDAAVFGTPTVAPGAIIPDTDGFLGIEDPGTSDGSFDSFFTVSGVDTITSNGVFFSFEVTALSEGAGSFDLTFVDALGIDDLGGSIEGASFGTDTLAYSVVIPEPTSLALLAIGGSGLLFRRRRAA